MTSPNFVATLVKNIVTCKNDVAIDSVEEVVLGDAAKHFLSVPAAITVKGKYLHNDKPFELSFFTKRALLSSFMKTEQLSHIFRNEKFVYEKLVPALEKVSGMELACPKFYGASEDYVLLQNLAATGYRSIDMVAGGDLEHTKFALQRLAHFHASSLKLKLDQPDEFASMSKHISSSFMETWLEAINEHLDGTCKPAYDALSSGGMSHVADYIRQNKLFEPTALQAFLIARAEDDLLNLFIHGDTKADNMMFQYEESSEGKTSETQPKIVNFKFVDFQTVRQNSILTDILLFLGTSADTSLFKSDLEGLLKSYFDDFLAACDQMEIKTRPTWDSFYRELHRISGYALVCLILYLPLHSVKIDKDLDWSKKNIDDFKDVYTTADMSLYQRKLLDYAGTLSKYFMKSQ